MKCPNCGFEDNPQWRNGFDYNSQYMRFDEAINDSFLKPICETLKDKKNFETVEGGHGLVYYRRGTGGIFLYRVKKEDFRIPRERKDHRKKVKS